ncbi:DPY30/SDC1 family protein [Aspergillus nidulans FGSC A4]|uniref:COMPASS complex subunit Sdc1, putative (AFU_orthologue AFUA_7G05270) n=1 Tax=Emericella nidulans (strain FGSC A4 / ATCC 38163 / CBS 112.46 / NRRL 194 / M139) TaxID=227321 RepID=C8V1L2_EMENI|nr:hypothetical protein [Aspergillus nidulans FGSC A4]CBF71230.1 TPA: COMPASS complex subunit Sdc1, putative (AFU_orthologue; AFUA_7G05270) [Aspergillus nidulans FGSC A4]
MTDNPTSNTTLIAHSPTFNPNSNSGFTPTTTSTTHPPAQPQPTFAQPQDFPPTATPKPNPNTNLMVNETSQLSSAGTGSAHTAAADPIASTVRPGGAPARVYMNEKIVPYLLEGMKTVTKEQPANPLRVLGEFLIQKSNEVEGPQSGNAPE